MSRSRRSLALRGWQADELAQAVGALGVVGALSMGLCFAALRGRVEQG